MTRISLTQIILLVFTLVLSTTATSDVLLIEQVRHADTLEVPYNGMGMDEVESRFGAPDTKEAAIGTPPISRWVYDRWSVFFEYDSVLYTVLHEGEVIRDEPQEESDTQADSDPDSESEPE